MNGGEVRRFTVYINTISLCLALYQLTTPGLSLVSSLRYTHVLICNGALVLK